MKTKQQNSYYQPYSYVVHGNKISLRHIRHSVKICQVNEEERGREVGKALPLALGKCYYLDVLTGPVLEGRHSLLLAGKSA